MQSSAILLDVERRARADGVAIISPQTGRFLSTMVTAMQASRILEVGTGYGYSTLSMALAQSSMGRIWTVENDSASAEIALGFFRKAGEDDYIEAFNTPPQEFLENFPHRNLDIVFIRANPHLYEPYLDLIMPMLKLSGLAVFSECTAATDFVERFLTHPALDGTVLPLDGGTAIGARCR